MYKILHIISDTNIGGAGKWIKYLIKRSDKDKFSHKVIIPKGSLLKNELAEVFATVIEVDAMMDKSFDLSAIAPLLKVFKSENPDIIHTHSSFSARVAAKIYNKAKIVFTRHCVDPNNQNVNHGIGMLLNKFLNEFFCDRIIATAEAAKQNLIENGISEKYIDVVINGSEPLLKYDDEKRLEIRKSFGLEKDDIVIGIVARLEEVKGHKYFIEAAKIVAQNTTKKVKFLIAGSGSLEQALKEQVIRLGLENYIIFAGFIENVAMVMNILDLNVNSSCGTETSNLAMSEGMSLGVPIVATDFGGNVGMVKNNENGFLVPNKNSQKLAEAMLNVIENDELRKRLSDNALAMYLKYYNSQKMANEIEKVYLKMLKK